MSQSNQISVALPQPDYDAVLAAITTIKTKLPFLINLSAEDRKTIAKMGDKSVAFVNKALEYSKNSPNIVPPYLDVPEFQKDVTLLNQLRAISQQLEPIAQALDDTYMLTASEAYAGSLIYYGAVKQAAKNNVLGADTISSDLGNRFPGGPRATKAPGAPTP